MAPNEAEIENRFVSTAFNGSTTEPVSRNKTTYVTRITDATATGVRCRMKFTMSRSYAVPPVASTCPSGTCSARTEFTMARASSLVYRSEEHTSELQSHHDL